MGHIGHGGLGQHRCEYRASSPAAGLAVIHEACKLGHLVLRAGFAVAGVSELWHARSLRVDVQRPLPQLVACITALLAQYRQWLVMPWGLHGERGRCVLASWAVC